MDKNTGTKIAESETPFPRLELWEDGSRIPELYKPENFEWWYFDVQLTDGRTLVLVCAGCDEYPFGVGMSEVICY